MIRIHNDLMLKINISEFKVYIPRKRVLTKCN